MRKQSVRMATQIIFSLLCIPAEGQNAAESSGGPVDTLQGNQQNSALAEVIVTAQKRSERSVNVPITVTSASADTLAATGIADIRDLSQIVPAFRIDYAAAYVQPSIRGIGTSNAGPGISSSVATYVDGFYQPSPAPSGFNFAGIENLQVLSGPQGTLFGRNSTGGAILITTKGPSFDPHVEADIGYGSWNTSAGNVFATSKIVDHVAGSIFLSGSYTDGFTKNDLVGGLADRGHDFAVRSKLLFEPNDMLRVTLGVDHSEYDSPRDVNYSPYKGQDQSVLLDGAPVVNSRGHVANYGYQATNAKSSGINLTGEVDLGFGVFKSFSQARAERLNVVNTFNGTSMPQSYVGYHLNEDTYSQEFDLSAKTGPFDWATGLFAYHDESSLPLTYSAPSNPPQLALLADFAQTTDTFAAFGDLTYHIGRFFLTAGARYSIDDARKKVSPTGAAALEPPKATFYSTTPRAVLRYELTPDSNFYVSYSKGNKPGIFDPVGPGTTPVRPEKITDIEGGYKLATGPLQFEISGFHYKYTDLQVSSYTNLLVILQNAGSVEVYGGQLHALGRVTNHITADVNVAYTHGEYTLWRDAAVYQWPTLNAVPVDVSGRPIQRAPRYSGNANVTYSEYVFGGKLDLTGAVSFQSNVYFDPNGGASQGGYALVNASASWTQPNEKVTYSLNLTNLTNHRYLIQVTETTGAFGQIWGAPLGAFGKVAVRF